jgi:digeranylgeranylglycerophospholipid reductase
MMDASIVGAGSSGSLAAKIIASKGFNVQVFEEHRKAGLPNHCAGMISVEGLELLGVDSNSEFVQNTIYGGRIFSDNGEYIEVVSKRPRALIIDRERFDEKLVEEATDVGAIYNFSSRVESLSHWNGSAINLRLEHQEAKSRLLIDAEGAGGRLLKRSGINTGQKGLLSGFNVEVDDVKLDPEIVEIWFSQKKFKGFFGWIIPLSEEKARCGLATSKHDGAEQLRMFVKQRFKNVEMPPFRSGMICSYGPIERTVYDNLMIVGDAAGQVKPTTGGGVVLGGLCAMIAGNIAVDSLEEDNYSNRKLGGYEKAWKEKYGGEFRTMLALRRMMNHLSDRLLCRTLHSFKKYGIENKLNELVEDGDMDMQSGIIRSALMDPAITMLLFRSVGKVVVDELLSVLGVPLK